MRGWLKPKARIDEGDVHRGMSMLLVDGACGQTMVVLTTGAFLVGFALLLGASNKVIGLFAAIGPLSLTLQIPAVYLVERLRRRRPLVLGTAGISRAAWLLIALLPWIAPREYLVPVFLAALFVHFGLGAVAGCAFNSWIRDLIPEARMSAFFAKRLALATAIGAGLSLAGGYLVDFWKAHLGDPLGAYSTLFAVAGSVGVVGIVFLGRTPEPQMPGEAGGGFFQALAEPFRNQAFRQLLIFLAWWSFAVNFAAPFFAVYLIDRLGLSMSWVLGLAVLSQLINVVCFQLWGSLADRFSNKSVLVLTGPWFIVSFLLWPFTTMPESYALTIPVLIVIHALAGVSTAGVNLCAGNLALKTAPYGKAGAYLAVNALISGCAATIAPIIAGFVADWFASEQLTLTLHLASSENYHPAVVLPAVDLRGLDFVFLIAFLLGLFSLHRLLAVREEGEVQEKVVRQALFAEMRRTARQISTVAGVRQLIAVPWATARRLGGLRNRWGGDDTSRMPD
ncbi:MAG: MFS transporter [Candidatus Hydrogenedentes bacterium]|nr:MFS transporter [Candidatus Hydrogenedentota bacterium]